MIQNQQYHPFRDSELFFCMSFSVIISSFRDFFNPGRGDIIIEKPVIAEIQPETGADRIYHCKYNELQRHS